MGKYIVEDLLLLTITEYLQMAAEGEWGCEGEAAAHEREKKLKMRHVEGENRLRRALTSSDRYGFVLRDSDACNIHACCLWLIRLKLVHAPQI